LGTGEADGFVAQLVYRHGEQGDGFLFSCGQQHVHLARARTGGNAAGEVNQFICFVTAGADYDHDIMSGLAGFDGTCGGNSDLFGIGDAGTTELLDDHRHGGVLSEKLWNPGSESGPGCRFEELRFV
jgi:hypothetical protein